MSTYLFTYLTNLPIDECISRLIQPPLHFKINWLFSRDYKIELVSQTRLFITFTTGYNLSNHRTRYQMDFCEHNSQTMVTMKFIDEKGGFPLPYVADWEITKLMEQRMDAALSSW